MLFSCGLFDPKIFVDMKERKLCPFACKFMSIMIPHLAIAFFWRDMVQSMGFLLAHLFFYHLPPTARLMCFSGGMPAAASKAIVLHTDGVLCLFEWKSNLLSSEDISVEILTENLCCLIIDFVLRIDHNDIFSSNLIKYLTNNLRMTGINEDKLEFGNWLFFW